MLLNVKPQTPKIAHGFTTRLLHKVSLADFLTIALPAFLSIFDLTGCAPLQCPPHFMILKTKPKTLSVRISWTLLKEQAP